MHSTTENAPNLSRCKFSRLRVPNTRMQGEKYFSSFLTFFRYLKGLYFHIFSNENVHTFEKKATHDICVGPSPMIPLADLEL